MASVATHPDVHWLQTAMSGPQFRALQAAAHREGQTVEHFVVASSLAAADANLFRSREDAPTQEQIAAIIRAAQAELTRSMPPGALLSEELVADRRIEALRELE